MKTSKRYLTEMYEMYGLPKELYTMKRGIKYEKDNIETMRYDITIIPPMIINGQFNKTKGHIHSSGHDERYYVLEGEAIFAFQCEPRSNSLMKVKGKKTKSKYGAPFRDWYTIRAKKGDQVHIPCDYYHATINPSKTKTLKLANWINDACVSDYSFIEKNKGMYKYYTTKGWVKNPNYKDKVYTRER